MWIKYATQPGFYVDPSLSGIWTFGPHPCPACGGALQMKKKISARASSALIFFFICGERGIRTPGPVKINGFQDRRIRPLCHLSNLFTIPFEMDCKDRYFPITCKIFYCFFCNFALLATRDVKPYGSWRSPE